jgi:hypothetical protein
VIDDVIRGQLSFASEEQYGPQQYSRHLPRCALPSGDGNWQGAGQLLA